MRDFVCSVHLPYVAGVGGVILLILGSIPNSADPMVVWFFSFSAGTFCFGMGRYF